MRLAAVKADIPFAVINAGDLPELSGVQGGSIDDLTFKLDGSGLGLSADEVLDRLEAAFEASEAVEEAIAQQEHLQAQAK